ncbi:hypothetical protein [Fodinibius salsisoli]|uniref:PAP2 superfamily protein n=1 Tax=Fodinibius salsisoli TaxID=2820877 RepID=A0ABT3PPU0_9BACT|nr:hypothetical protein [Fodinibius salsisoli]MCW9707870.1 hypothetical protein [Fodinibius salsisoli]
MHHKKLSTSCLTTPEYIKDKHLDRISADSGLPLTGRLQYRGPARLISDLMNPLFLPPLVLAILSWELGLPGSTISWITGLSLLFHTAIPLAVTFYLLKNGHITSPDLPRRSARTRLFGYSIASCFIAFVGLGATVPVTHPLIAMVALIYLVNPVIGLLINLKWKVSIHTAALSSAGAIFLGLTLPGLTEFTADTFILSLTILLLLLPLMIWSRYRLGAHSYAELLGGIASGFLLTIIELYLFNIMW